jgi:hypothetical protein
VNLNELVFYEGLTKRDPQPRAALREHGGKGHADRGSGGGDQQHEEQEEEGNKEAVYAGPVVTCSSEFGPETECWRAFDKDASHGSRWRSKDAGRVIGE